MKPSLNRFVIVDPTKCVSCRSCEVAFATGHRDNNDDFTVGNMDIPIASRLFIVKDKKGSVRIQCRQCKDSLCVNRCSRTDGLI